MTGGRDTILGYRIKEQLGSGARTSIYRVVDARDREFALKYLRIRSEADKRFLVQMRHEHAVARRLAHAGIRKTLRLRLRRAWFRAVEAVLVMDFIDGSSLADSQRRSLADTLECFHQIAEALASMHRRGWVHADIKPTNVICSADGAVLIDLGQAAPVGSKKARVQGTPGFMAPEQVLRDPITSRTDIFGFGATLYWFFSGTSIPTLISGGTGERAARSTLNREPPKVSTPLKDLCPDVPEELSDLVAQCTALKPHDRPTRIEEVIGGLTKLRAKLKKDGVS